MNPESNQRSSAPPASNRSWRGWWLFLAVGLAGYLVLTFGVFALHEWARFSERLAYGIMIFVVMIGNFLANRRLVFPSGRTGEPARQAVRFFVVALLSRGVEFALYSLCIGPLGINYLVAIAVTSAISYGGKYYLFSRFVFR